jgi:hypothetical protein
MSQSTTLILLPQTSFANPGNGQPYTVVGNSQPAAAYYLGNKDLQTVNLSCQEMTGNIIIEASLASQPSGDTDWFKVYEFEANANATPNSIPQLNSNAAIYTNVDGNFVFMRAKVQDFAGGVVNFVKLSY